MPDRMHIIDTAYPNFHGMETTEEKVTAIQNYLFMLLEELRYLLRHLDAGNFSEAGLRELAETVTEQTVETRSTELTNNAEALFDRLSTSRRIRAYFLEDMSDERFVRVQDGYLRFVTGSVISTTALLTEEEDALTAEAGSPLTLEWGAPAATQAVNRYGQRLYWRSEPAGHTAEGDPVDSAGKLIYATADITKWPVTVYRYSERTDAQLAYKPEGNAYLPKIILGAGDENGNSKGYIFKDDTQLLLRYVTALQKNVDISFGEDGFVDAMHRRLASLALDTDAQLLTYTMEGSGAEFTVSYTVSGDTVTFTWPDGFSCQIDIPDGGGGGDIPVPSSAAPKMDGEASAGVASTYARGDHRHPADTTKVTYDDFYSHTRSTLNPHQVTAEQIQAVPTSRKVNGQSLYFDVTLNAASVGAVPTTRNVNGKALSSDITLTATDVGARADNWTPSAADVGAQPTITAAGILKGDGSGGVTAATAGTDYQAALDLSIVNGQLCVTYEVT